MIPLAKPSIGRQEVAGVERVLKSGWLISGPYVEEFERKVARFIGTRHAVAVNSGTAALHTALAACGIRPGDEVLVPSFTFIASANSVLHQGAHPVLVDVDPHTYNIDPAAAEGKITEKTKAIMVVHQFGQPAYMKPLLEICEERRLVLVEDAACAFGAKYDGRRVGGIGDAGCFSFHPRKIITTGEGGMITTNDDEVAKKARQIRSQGMKVETWRREKSKDINLPKFSLLGYNYRMPDVAAAIGLAQLVRVKSFIDRRRKIAKLYDEGLKDIDEISGPKVIDGAFHAYQSYVVRVEMGDRDRVITELRRRGIASQVGTQAIHLEPLYQAELGYKAGDLPGSEEALRKSLSLPIFYDLTDRNVRKVVNAVRETVSS